MSDFLLRKIFSQSETSESRRTTFTRMIASRTSDLTIALENRAFFADVSESIAKDLMNVLDNKEYQADLQEYIVVLTKNLAPYINKAQRDSIVTYTEKWKGRSLRTLSEKEKIEYKKDIQELRNILFSIETLQEAIPEQEEENNGIQEQEKELPIAEQSEQESIASVQSAMPESADEVERMFSIFHQKRKKKDHVPHLVNHLVFLLTEKGGKNEKVLELKKNLQTITPEDFVKNSDKIQRLVKETIPQL